MASFAANVFGSNVETVDAQNSVADSILDDSNILGTVNELYESTEESTAVMDEDGDYGQESPESESQEPAEAEEQEAPERNENAEQSVKELENELNPEIQFQEKASEVIEQYGLNDPESGNQLALEMEEALAPLGLVVKEGEGIHAEKFQDVMLEAMMLSQSIQNPDLYLHPKIANALTVKLHEAMGGNAQVAMAAPIEQRIAIGQTLKCAFDNIEMTAARLHKEGKPVTVETINQDRNGTRIAVNTIMGWIAGEPVQVPDKIAFPIADRLVDWYLSRTERILNPQEEEPGQDNPFDDEAMEIYRSRHGAL